MDTGKEEEEDDEDDAMDTGPDDMEAKSMFSVCLVWKVSHFFFL